MKSPAKLTFETILLIAAVVAVLIAPIAADASHHGASPPSLADFDTDDDGFLTEEEFQAGHAARHAKMAEQGRPMKGMASAPAFSDFDTDGDGKLSAEEFSAGHHKHMAEMRQSHQGKDKHKHKHEHGQRAHATYEEMDINGDGCIDKAELDAHHATER